MKPLSVTFVMLLLFSSGFFVAQAQLFDPGNMMSYRGNNYTTYQICIDLTSSPSGSVWGGCSPSSGTYTDDSRLTVAAKHWYGLADGYSYFVNVRVVPGLSSYGGCTQNGVTTSSYSSWGGSYDFQGYSGPYPGGVSGLSVSAPTANSVTASWNAVSGASYYYYQIQTSPTFTGWGTGLYNAALSTTSYTYNSASPGTTYYVFISAVNSSWAWATYRSGSAVTPATCTTPGTPQSLVMTPTGTTTANLSWSAGSPAGSPTVTYYYYVYNSGGSYITGGSTTSTSASVSGLSANSNYYFNVRAYSSCNATYSSYSANSSTITTFPNPPTSISTSASAIDIGESTTLTANGVVGTVYWYNTACGSGSIGTGNSILVSPTITTTYYAKNNNGNLSPTCASAEVYVSQLPVELLELKAICNNGFGQLIWSTASESNNCCFMVERSLDGSAFFQIEEVPGAGNSNSIHNYVWKESEPLGEVIYYRIRQTDFDGTETVYGPVTANCTSLTGASLSISVFPNPFDNEICVQADGIDGVVKVQVYDQFGRLIFENSILCVRREFTIELPELETGLYDLVLINGTSSQSVRVLKE